MYARFFFAILSVTDAGQGANLIPSLISVDSWFEVLELKFNVNSKQRLVQFLRPSREVRAALNLFKD